MSASVSARGVSASSVVGLVLVEDVVDLGLDFYVETVSLRLQIRSWQIDLLSAIPDMIDCCWLIG